MCPSNYNRFSDRARYWSKIVIFSYPLHSTPHYGSSLRNSATLFSMEKLEWLGDKNSKTSVFVLAQLTNVTDGQTDRQTDGQMDRHRVPAYTALMHMHRVVKMIS